METPELNRDLLREVLASLPQTDRIEMHPWQAQSYEEKGFAGVTIDFSEGKMPGFDGVQFGAPGGLTICGIPVLTNTQLPKDIVNFFAGERLIGVTRVAEPVLES